MAITPWKMHVWPSDLANRCVILILGNGQNEQVSDRFCPILSGGEGGSTLVMPNLQFRKNSFCVCM